MHFSKNSEETEYIGLDLMMGMEKSKVNEFESFHVYYQTALCSPLRTGSTLGNKQALRVFCFLSLQTYGHNLLVYQRLRRKQESLVG